MEHPQPDDTPANAGCLVRLDRVTMRFGGNTVFANLSLSLRRGERLALLGPNGAGKSTLLRLLQGDLRPGQEADVLQGRTAAGGIYWNFEGKEEPFAVSALKHARLVSPGQQRNYARQGWKLTGEEIVLSGLDNAAMIYGEMSGRHYERAARLAEAAGAGPLMGMTAPAMSQGQLRLVLLLRALMSKPALLLLDEPFDGLDAASRERVTRCIALAAEQGGTLVVSAHRDEDIPPFITKGLLLRNGGVKRVSLPLSSPSGKDDDVEANTVEVGLCTEGCVPGPTPRKGIAHRACVPEPPLTHAFGDNAIVSGVSAFAGPDASAALSPNGPPLVELAHVDVFTDRVQILFDITWAVRPGEQWIVSGDNGSGKSTLLRLLYGEEFAAYGGTLRWRGGPRPSLEDLRAQVGYVSDRLQYAYDYDLSAEDVVVSGPRGSIGLYGEPDARERALARDWLDVMGLYAVRGKNFHSLSSGTARRVLLARALAASPPLLLLDEPCSGLDAQSRAFFLRGLAVLAGKGVTIVHVTHHEQDKSPLFTRELRLEKGRVAFMRG